jgi:hypothetical protein
MWRMGDQPLGRQVITWIIAIVFSGLGGSAFTYWWTTRSTIINYTVNRTSLGADETAVVPDIKVGGETLQSLFIYNIKLQYSSGPELEGAKIAIALPSYTKLVGKVIAEGPGPLFHISCEPFAAQGKDIASSCSLARLRSDQSAYTVSFATSGSAEPSISVDGKNVRVEQVQVGGRTQSKLDILLFLLQGVGVGLMVIFGAELIVRVWVRLKNA